MIKLIIKRLISNYENVSEPEVREKYGILGGVLGIICNFTLFVLKISIGLFINSIAVISDAFNNLSDVGVAMVSVIGARLSGKRADQEHPYGHGRAEYISALVIGVLIIMVGIELLKSSVSAVISPNDIEITSVSAFILLIPIPIKLWMWSYNRYIGKRINSAMLMAASKDSLNDLIVNLCVLVSAIVSPFLNFSIDGVVGLCASALIIWTGIGVARDTINRLMGAAPSSKMIEEIEKRLMSNENIIGTHDLMVHDYGPGRVIASVHAEVPDNLSLIEVHNFIDVTEHDILENLGVDIVIHMDPVPFKKK